jgi:hypothetical protein
MTRHIHKCHECGRGFYLCSARDCDVAPEVCRGCELDRQDAYLNSLTTPPQLTHKDTTSHG